MPIFASRRILTPLLAALVICSATSSFAQVASSGMAVNRDSLRPQSRSGIGVSVSVSSGAGLSFRYYQGSSGLGIQLSGYGWGASNGSQYGGGVEAQYDIAHLVTYRFFALAGAAYFFDNTFRQDATIAVKAPADNQLESPLRAGIGLGFEEFVVPHLGVSLATSFTYYFASAYYDFLPSGGIHYYF